MMEVCLLTDRADHTVLAGAVAELERRHRVRILIPADVDMPAALASELESPADMYLLKSRSRDGLELAVRLEQHGALVVNSTAATGRCRDRAAMAQCLSDWRIPAPRTLALGKLRAITTVATFPAIVKSQVSHRGDLIRTVADASELRSLGDEWADEPVIVQVFAAGDGWDYKFWAIGGDVMVGRRLSPLVTGATGDEKITYDIQDAAVARAVRALGTSAAQAFGLELFGIDVLFHDGAAVVVDVNAFPGFRGFPAAASKLAAYIEHVAARNGVVA